jgi:SAM-dependent methyltransferase
MGARATDNELERINRDFYEPLWRQARLIRPERFNTWPVVCSLAPGRRCLEVAPGLRPHLPLQHTQFVDLSENAVAALKRAGAQVQVGRIGELPFADASFDFVGAFDIVEHVRDDEVAMQELARVLSAEGVLLMSVPLYARCWTRFDDFVGHYRRYEPEALVTLLARFGLHIEKSAAFGMQPRSSKILDLGMWYLTHQRERAMWWYNNVFMPLGVRFQKPLSFLDGFVVAPGVDEVIVLCRTAVDRPTGQPANR